MTKKRNQFLEAYEYRKKSKILTSANVDESSAKSSMKTWQGAANLKKFDFT